MNIFCDTYCIKILWIFFFWGGGVGGGGGHHKFGLYLEVISMHFRVFCKGKLSELGIFFWAAKISNFFGGA